MIGRERWALSTSIGIHVIVIGGGGRSQRRDGAGRAGASVTVLEARPSAGGRASAFTDPATGERVDNGQHVLIGCYDETFRFLRRIGADANVRLQKTLAVQIVDGSGRSSRLECPAWPAPLHLLAGVLSWNASTGATDRRAADRPGPLRRGSASDAARGRTPDGEAPAPTVRQWLETIGQTPRSIELLWEPLAVAALNQSIDVASAGPFREVVRRMFARRAATPRSAFRPFRSTTGCVNPTRSFIERRGGDVCTGTAAVLHADASARARVSPFVTRRAAARCGGLCRAVVCVAGRAPVARSRARGHR